MNENKKLAKDIKSASQKGGPDVMAQAAELLNKAEKIGGADVIVGRIDAVDIEQARIAIDSLKKKAGSAAVVLAMADGENVTLLAGVTDDLIAKGLKAGDIIKDYRAACRRRRRRPSADGTGRRQKPRRYRRGVGKSG